MNVRIDVVPHSSQRYPSVGDWQKIDGVLYIRISDMKNWRYEMLVAVHELVEVLMCWHDGVTEKSVDRFDIAFEKARKPGNHDEPGDDPHAPYSRQHGVATGIERILAVFLGVSWKAYEKKVDSL